MKLEPYNLPDAELLEDTESVYRIMVWEPARLSIVIGQSNDPETSVIIENIEADNVPVYKRPSGGETVVLSSRTLVISILKRGDRFQSPRNYFMAYNEKIIRTLRKFGIKNHAADGISDIRIGDKKILGSSIYRNKDRVLYHAVLNRAESTETFERYLKHPAREPGYRHGRSHRDFVTSLEAEGYALTYEILKNGLLSSFLACDKPVHQRMLLQ